MGLNLSLNINCVCRCNYDKSLCCVFILSHSITLAVNLNLKEKGRGVFARALLKNLDCDLDLLGLSLESRLFHVESFYLDVCAILLESEGSFCSFKKVERRFKFLWQYFHPYA